MRILALDDEPLHELLYLEAAPRGGSATRRLPIMRGRVDRLPDGLDALLVTSDLQGVAPSWSSGGQSVLLGEVLAEQLERLAGEGLVPPMAAVGVILAGDLYAAPGGDKRGASGDVRDVWLAFASVCRWVVGVAGNHDRFGSDREARRFRDEPGIHLLDGDTVEVDGLRIGGVSLIIGNPAKPGRRSEDDFLASLQRVLDDEPDIVILHEGPDGDAGQRGNPQIRARLAAGTPALAICGHDHWHEPLAELDSRGRARAARGSPRDWHFAMPVSPCDDYCLIKTLQSPSTACPVPGRDVRHDRSGFGLPGRFRDVPASRTAGYQTAIASRLRLWFDGI
jgi:Icc protein